MKTVLPPIFHRDTYTVLVERPILAYFRETLYEPLFNLLGHDGIELRENTLGDWKEFPRSWGSLGLARSDMPQIRGEQRKELRQFLAAKGVSSIEFSVSVRAIRPTQDLYSPSKVQAAREHKGEDRSILISSDNHILDGHHQWVAALLDRPVGKVKVVQFNAPIRQLIWQALQLPGVTRENERKDEKGHSALWDAIVTGAVWYAHGVFSGAFNAAISRELRALGARRQGEAFVLAQAEVPLALRGVITESMLRSEQLHRTILSTLETIEENIGLSDTGLSLDLAVDTILPDLQEQLVESVSSVGGLETPSPIPPGMPETLKQQLVVDVNRKIRGFAVEATQQLRAKVQANLTAGGRTDRLAQVIEAEFGVAKRRARFIADQETSLLVSKFREQRFTELGSTEYVWDTSHDEKVRDDHAALDGKRFAWSSPPITNRATGARNNPGEDYGCRCVPRAVLNALLNVA